MTARRAPPPRGPQLELAGDLSVAFVNTAGARDDNRQLAVASYADLLTWSLQAGVVTAREAELLRQQAARDGSRAQAVFAAAETLRSALSRTFSAIVSGKVPAAGDLAAVSDELTRRMPALRLVPGEHGVTWSWAGGEDDLERVLWPVLLAATDLLTSEAGRAKLRRCAAKSCPLFFAQRSARARIWCDRKTCGSRGKALRYYHRTGKFAPRPPRRGR
jgi:predicted RNA-binding Zn ribbon-like protein